MTANAPTRRPRGGFLLVPVLTLVAAAGPPAGRTDELRYKLAPGQTFGYRVELLSESAGGAERYAGTPVFLVKEVEKNDTIVLSAVARLDYATRPRGAAAFAPQPGMDVWLGSRVTVDPHGHDVGGRKDSVYGPLPAMFQEVLPLKRLLFVELPFRRSDTYVNSGTATLFQTEKGGLLGPKLATTRGYIDRSVRAEADPAGGVRLTQERAFRTTEGAKREWRYRGTSRFDPARGLLLATDGTYTGDESPVPIRITVRLLDGADFQRALAQSVTDAARRPPEQDPIEDRRVRLDLKSPTRLKTTAGLKPGTVVAHFKDGDYKWYLADVVEVLSDHSVAVRLRGSKEELDVHPGQLARPPADQLPKK